MKIKWREKNDLGYILRTGYEVDQGMLYKKIKEVIRCWRQERMVRDSLSSLQRQFSFGTTHCEKIFNHSESKLLNPAEINCIDFLYDSRLTLNLLFPFPSS